MSFVSLSRPAVIAAILGVGAVMVACERGDAPSLVPTAPAAHRASASSSSLVSVYASGFMFPRGLVFASDGTLYVAEGGSGGDHSTGTTCTQVVPPVGPYTNGPTARISKVDVHGTRTTFAVGFPSGVNALGDVVGVEDLAIQGGKLYALVSGGGCSHGSATVPAVVARVESDGSWSPVADLSAYQAANPVAHPFAGDYEPDGTWFSMIRSGDRLLAVEPNHGELAWVSPRTGDVQRLVDVSATQGHIVPTAIVEHDGAFYVGNLGGFPVIPGAQKILRITRTGSISVAATGFTTILGLAFDHAGRLYVLESTPVAGFPTPMTGQVVRLDAGNVHTVIASGLFLPTAMRFGPDGALYVSNKGYGPPQSGEILRITVP